MKVERFDREVVRRLNEELKARLASYGAEVGLTVLVDGIKFHATEAKVRLTMKVGTDQSEIERAEWERECIFVGMKRTDLGRSCTVQGKQLKIVGVQRRSRKYPIIVQDQTGKRFKARRADLVFEGGE